MKSFEEWFRAVLAEREPIILSFPPEVDSKKYTFRLLDAGFRLSWKENIPESGCPYQVWVPDGTSKEVVNLAIKETTAYLARRYEKELGPNYEFELERWKLGHELRAREVDRRRGRNE